jgi:head-tail adaptor
MTRVQAWAGEYDKYVTVYRNSSTRSANPDGQRPESREEYCRRWCSVIPVRATERLLSQQIRGDITHEVRMRRDTLTKAMTSKYWMVLSDGTRLNIRGGPYDVGGKKMELSFSCVERQ